MSIATRTSAQPSLPDHTQLPERDDTVVENFLEQYQTALLTGTIRPWMELRNPDQEFCVGADNFIYWKITDPPTQGAKAPDWFYIPGLPQELDGRYRRSYVLWQELQSPTIVIEYVSGNGNEERDRTPETGKFWVYERGIKALYYAIYEVDPGCVEVHQLVGDRYARVAPNEHGRYPITPLGLELGIWHGTYAGQENPWLRFWDDAGRLLPSDAERAEDAQRAADKSLSRAEHALREAERAQREAERARHEVEAERERADRLALRLRELGFDPDEAT